MPAALQHAAMPNDEHRHNASTFVASNKPDMSYFAGSTSNSSWIRAIHTGMASGGAFQRSVRSRIQSKSLRRMTRRMKC